MQNEHGRFGVAHERDHERLRFDQVEHDRLAFCHAQSVKQTSGQFDHTWQRAVDEQRSIVRVVERERESACQVERVRARELQDEIGNRAVKGALWRADRLGNADQVRVEPFEANVACDQRAIRRVGPKVPRQFEQVELVRTKVSHFRIQKGDFKRHFKCFFFLFCSKRELKQSEEIQKLKETIQKLLNHQQQQQLVDQCQKTSFKDEDDEYSLVLNGKFHDRNSHLHHQQNQHQQYQQKTYQEVMGTASYEQMRPANEPYNSIAHQMKYVMQSSSTSLIAPGINTNTNKMHFDQMNRPTPILDNGPSKFKSSLIKRGSLASRQLPQQQITKPENEDELQVNPNGEEDNCKLYSTDSETLTDYRLRQTIREHQLNGINKMSQQSSYLFNSEIKMSSMDMGNYVGHTGDDYMNMVKQNKTSNMPMNYAHMPSSINNFQQPVEMWSVDSVAKWLTINDLGALADLFVRNSINGERLMSFDTCKLKQIGVKSQKERDHIKSKIKELKQDNTVQSGQLPFDSNANPLLSKKKKRVV